MDWFKLVRVLSGISWSLVKQFCPNTMLLMHKNVYWWYWTCNNLSKMKTDKMNKQKEKRRRKSRQQQRRRRRIRWKRGWAWQTSKQHEKRFASTMELLIPGIQVVYFSCFFGHIVIVGVIATQTRTHFYQRRARARAYLYSRSFTVRRLECLSVFELD